MPPGGAAGAQEQFWLFVQLRSRTHGLRVIGQSVAYFCSSRSDHQGKTESDWLLEFKAVFDWMIQQLVIGKTRTRNGVKDISLKCCWVVLVSP